MIKTPKHQLLFFDIETVSEYETLEEFKNNDPKKYQVFVDYQDFFLRRYPEDADLSLDEIYFLRAPLVPEFAKVVCASFCFFDKSNKLHKTTFSSHDEVEILTETRKLLDKVERLGFELCGHNVKIFDIPTLSKRFMIHNMKLPKLFPSYNTKPWELKVVDTKELWNFGNNFSIASLDLVCVSMGVDSPKDNDVTGKNLNKYYWETKDLEKIADYCEKDTVALSEIIDKVFNLK